MVYIKKSSFRTNGPFSAQKWHILITLDQLEESFKNFAEWYGLIGTWKIFEKKIHLGQFDLFTFRPFLTVWLVMVKLSQDNVNGILKQSGQDFFHDYYWILKQSGHDFSGEYLCVGYCMDIMWCFCLEVKIHGFLKLL